MSEEFMKYLFEIGNKRFLIAIDIGSRGGEVFKLNRLNKAGHWVVVSTHRTFKAARASAGRI
jgi:hypothetical protein